MYINCVAWGSSVWRCFTLGWSGGEAECEMWTLSKVDFWTFPRLMDFWTFPRLMDFWTFPRLKFVPLIPERRRHLLILSIGILVGKSSIYFFEVNDVLCRFDYNYESVCDADLQLNQIIVSVAPELFSRKRFSVSLRMAWRARMFSRIDWKRDSHTWLKITIS